MKDADQRMNMMNDSPGEQDNETYRIGELAEDFGVTLRTLRFYEDKGLLTPTRVGVTRLFTKRDRARLKLILLGKRLGFSLSEVKRMIELYDPQDKNVTQLKVALKKGEAQMRVLEEQRSDINIAINELQRTIDIVREMLPDES